MRKYLSDQALSDFLRFISHSPSPYHAARELAKRFAHVGFEPLSFQESWQLKEGASYFVEEGGTLFAFSVPHGPFHRAVALASHTDSPALKLKPHPVRQEEGLTFYKTEMYGSPLKRTYLDRDLQISGRIITKEGHESLVIFDDIPCIIPSLSIHLMDKDEDLNPEKHLLPLASLSASPLDFSQLNAFDLFVTPLEEPRLMGPKGELIASYRLDNLVSAYAGMVALTHSQPTDHLKLYAAFNHEEIGSSTEVGASSPLFLEVFERLSHALHMDREASFAALHRSLCISSDNAQGYHPLYPDKYDKENTPKLGQGVALKVNANRRYSSYAGTLSPLMDLAKKHHIKLQHYTARADQRSGSTVGSLHATATGMPTLDIGVPQFAMHSARELIATSDFHDLCHLLGYALEELHEPL